MKFAVYNTDFSCDYIEVMKKYPCLSGYKPRIEKRTRFLPFLQETDEVEYVFISIDSIMDLLTLRQEVDCDIIITETNFDNLRAIEIYDGYRE